MKLQGPKEKEKGIYYEFDTEKNILGEGGMGVVYLGNCYMENGHRIRPVAIKRLKLKEYEIVERTRREANIQLNNDNLVRMYGMIETLDDAALGLRNYYVISEYLEGVMLDGILEGRLTGGDGKVYPAISEFYQQYQSNREEVATYIVRCVLSGVMALHDAGYIHRDIDPTNIMVTTDGKIKLIDFGIAKQLDTLKTAVSITTPGQFIGKAEYAAPELLLGDVNRQGFYTDVYAIGILYYQLLTGHIPFGGSKLQVIDMQMKSKLPLKEIKSRQIRSIIAKATEKEREDRYPTATHFRVALEELDFNKKTSSQVDKRWILGAACGMAAALLVGGVGYLLTRPVNESVPDTPPVTAPVAVETDTAASEPSATQPETAEENKQVQPKEAETKIAGKEPAKETGTQKSEKQEAKLEQKSEKKTLDLGYATWRGPVSGGKPNGEGVMTFKQTHAIQGTKKTAHAGDRVEGYFENGRLSSGTLITDSSRVAVVAGF